MDVFMMLNIVIPPAFNAECDSEHLRCRFLYLRKFAYVCVRTQAGQRCSFGRNKCVQQQVALRQP